MVLFLSGDDVAKALPMSRAIAVLRSAMAELSAGECAIPPRTHMDIPDRSGVALVMSACSPSRERMAVKVITLFDGNPEKQLPRIQALVLLLDAGTGTPLAVMDGAVLTAIRTGAASGVATDALARREAGCVAIFGAGRQARTQLEAVSCVRQLDAARVYDPDRDAADRFAREMGQRLSIVVDVAPTASAALQGADIVCTATVSQHPVFADSDIRPGMHINAIGSYKPHVQEIPSSTVARSLLVVDHLPSALQEAGDILVPLRRGLISAEHVHAEIGEILLGRKPGRTFEEEITLYKSVGVAAQDLAAASAALEAALELGLGTEVVL